MLAIVNLPEEVVVEILLHLSTSDLLVCRQVCRFLRDLADGSTLRARFVLSRAGMVGGAAANICTRDLLKALYDYETAWRESGMRPGHRDLEVDSRCIPHTGCVLPIISGTKLRLISHGSSIRNVQPREWTLNIEVLQIEVDYCFVDLAQGLLVLSGSSAEQPDALQCHILSLSASDQQHPSYSTMSAEPILTLPKIALYAQTQKLAICGELLGLVRLDEPTELRIYNWRTGALLMRHTHSDGVLFGFLDNQHIIIVSSNELCVRSIDPHSPRDPISSTDRPPSISRSFVLSLPPAVPGAHLFILELESLRHTPPAEGQAAFDLDPDLAILSIVVLAIAADSRVDPHGRRYLIHVPLTAILAATSAYSRPSAPGEDCLPHIIPWAAWGDASSRWFLFQDDEWREFAGLSVMGSKAAVVLRRDDTLPITLDVFIYDVHSHANLGGRMNDDSSSVAGWMNPNPVIRDGRAELLYPIRNSLPYRVLHKRITYPEDIRPEEGWVNVSVGFLEDGLVITLKNQMDTRFWLLHLLTV